MVSVAYRWLADRWYFFTTFFPVQLLLLHLRRSHLLMVFWLILFGFVGGFFGEDYGFRYLFLSPEYLQKTDVLSYFMLGLTLGLFIMAFHISSYIYYSYRYPFLATLNRPLWKFSLNNSLIPLLFISYLCYQVVVFAYWQNYPAGTIARHITGLLGGIIIMISLTFSYFINTLQTLEPREEQQKSGAKPWQQLARLVKPSQKTGDARPVVNYYLRNPWRITLARPVSHYSRHQLMQTMEQHHFSAALFFLMLMALIIGLGLVSGKAYFVIPAGASVFLLLSMYLMVTGAFYARLKTWTVTLGIAIILILNALSRRPAFQSRHYAYGMSYDSLATYDYQHLARITRDSIVAQDLSREREVLERWKAKFAEERPKMVLVNVSGGGLRSTLWTLQVMQSLDTLAGTRFFDRCHLITGSSGGMLGAAYYRELRMRQNTGSLPRPATDRRYLERASQDLLNPVVFNLVVNDLFFNFHKVNSGRHRYPADRGYTFEQTWHKHTEGLMDKRFGDYAAAERQANIPTFILSPTLVGDGRKLLMATRPMSYLSYSPAYSSYGDWPVWDGVEFRRFFAKQEPDSLHFLTALRMSASFPYITPLVNLPAEPSMDLIDAGVRDNEGLEMALRYIRHHDEWLAQNTAGVLILQIKANRPELISFENNPLSTIDRLSRPIDGVVKSFSNLQIYNKALLMDFAREALTTPLEVTRFALFDETDNISLSWHLTEREKKRIRAAIRRPEHQNGLREVQDRLTNP